MRNPLLDTASAALQKRTVKEISASSVAFREKCNSFSRKMQNYFIKGIVKEYFKDL